MPSSAVGTPERRRMFLLFFGLAFVVRLAIAVVGGMFQRNYFTEMEGIARNVAAFGNYGLYYSPTAFSTPVFPLLLAAIFKLFGSGMAGRAVSVLLACAASSLRCALLPLFALDAGFDILVAWIAGGLSVLYIGALDTEVNGGLDGPYVALTVLVIVWAAMRYWRDGSWRTRTPWWFFAFCGFSALLNPSVLTIIGGVLVAGMIACPPEARGRYLRQAALVVCAILVFLLPWAYRNYRMMGTPILTRSNFGIEFWVSNGPGRTFDHPTNYGTFHPSQNKAEAAQVGALGEVEYSRLRMQEGMAWVRDNPGAYLRFTVERIAAWWFPPHPLLLMPFKSAMTLLAFAGLWLLFQRDRLLAWLMVATWITFPDIYYLVQWSSRYRYPMDWQIVFCASVALFAAWQAVRSRRETARDIPAVA